MHPFGVGGVLFGDYLEIDLNKVVPKQIVVIPKPFDKHISVQEAIEQRLFEVKLS